MIILDPFNEFSTCSNAFYYLYNIRRIRKYLSRRSTETLIHAFVSNRIDYCNSLLYGLPTYQLTPAFSVTCHLRAFFDMLFKRLFYCERAIFHGISGRNDKINDNY